jgi:hypothetical protein
MQITSINIKSPHCFKYGVLRWFFILCGGQFYLNWILPTNPTSKNPVIKLLYGWMKALYTAKDVTNRYYCAIIYGSIHIIMGTLMFIDGRGFTIGNLLVNIYPIIVQVYIGVRCWRIKNFRRTNRACCQCRS